MEPQLIAKAARVGNVIESLLAALHPGRDGPTAKLLRIVPHRSVGDATCLTVRGRVVRQAPTNRRPLGGAGAIPAREHLAAVYRAFDALEVPFARVEVTLDGLHEIGECNAAGFFSVDLRAPVGRLWHSGRHTPTVRVRNTSPAARTADRVADVQTSVDVFVPGAHATLMIVSDLDDTAMDTNTISTIRSLRTVMFRSARRRQEVPGVPALYRALQGGADGSADNPVCYISSGAWNLYDVVLDYLDTHDLPRGAILLNDWGSRSRGFHAVAHGHKAEHVSALLARVSSLPFLLVGDNVQEDPELYTRVALQHPGRIAAIWIREIRRDASRRRDIDALRQALVAVGTELVMSDNTARFANDAEARGWIPPR